MDPVAKMQPRPFKRNFFQAREWENKDAASRRIYLMSLKRHKEIYPNESRRRPLADASTTRWMSFLLAIP